ncbi:quinolinate synthase NadA [bacterium]|nr:MAG: quinolinate synthase NadA [bacterium]TNF01300.1 MAG: quinolinate synthase NadA [Bacteroidota bacterium]
MGNVFEEIIELKRDKNAIILSHFYQDEKIQMIADFIGDSLELSRKAAVIDKDIIVFCGVHFMAETAKLLNPTKKVLLPDLNAGCSLADNCSATELLAFKLKNPQYKIVTYINCSAEVKALSDVVCTSSNAKQIIESFPINQQILFAPDRNLGAYLQTQVSHDLEIWDGACIVHEAFSIQKIIDIRLKFPEALILAHPESESSILKLAQFIGSTSQMIRFVTEHPKETFIVATEAGILLKMKELAPHATIIPAPVYEDNTCACSECAYMKVNTLEKVRDCLLNESPEIVIDSNIAELARKPIDKMLTLSI